MEVNCQLYAQAGLSPEKECHCLSERHWDRFFCDYFSFPLPAIFQHCAMFIHSSVTDGTDSFLN